MLNRLVFSDISMDAIIAAEMLRVVHPETEIVYVRDISVTEQFFTDERYTPYDEIYFIGDVMEDSTRDYITSLDIQARLFGMSDSQLEAEGYSWMRFVRSEGSLGGWYARRVLQVIDDKAVTSQFSHVILALSGKSLRQYNVFVAMYMSMGDSSFAEWAHDRLKSVYSGEKLFDELSQVIADHIMVYQQSLDKAMFAMSKSDGRVAKGFVRTASKEEVGRYLDRYAEEKVIKLFSLEDNKMFTIEQCSQADSNFKFENKFYFVEESEGDF